MRCQEAKTMLYAYLDHSLRDEIERELFMHLSHCPDCRQELGYARQTHALLEKYCTIVEPPKNFGAGVMKAIGQLEQQKAAQRKAASKKLGRESKDLVWNFKRLGQVASVAILATALWWASFSGSGPQIAKIFGPDQPFAGKIVEVPDPGGHKFTNTDPANKGQQGKMPDGDNPELTPPADGDFPGGEESLKGPGGEETGGLVEIPEQKGDDDDLIKAGGETDTEPAPGQEVYDPVPVPEIQEPSGTIVAAGAKQNEVIKSVLLEKVNVKELGDTYKFVAAEVEKEIGLTGLDGKAVGSPAGSELVYGKEGKIYLASSLADEGEIIGEPGGKVLGLAWARDGKSLAANVMGSRGQQGLWAGNVNGGWQLLVEIGGGKEISWSPDGEKVAFTDHRGMAYVLTFQDGVKDKLYPITRELGNSEASELAWSVNSDALLMKWAASGEGVATWMATLP
ncbi:MAG: zf-HC2 domain-containing protein [Bacillota bacterium]